MPVFCLYSFLSFNDVKFSLDCQIKALISRFEGHQIHAYGQTMSVSMNQEDVISSFHTLGLKLPPAMLSTPSSSTLKTYKIKCTLGVETEKIFLFFEMYSIEVQVDLFLRMHEVIDTVVRDKLVGLAKSIIEKEKMISGENSTEKTNRY